MLDFELSLSLISARNENEGEIPHPRKLFSCCFCQQLIRYLTRIRCFFFCYFWSLLTYLNFQQEILKRADELLCARATRAQTGTKLVVNRKWAKFRCFGIYFAKKFLIYNDRPSWMTVAKSISQTVTCHIDKGFKLYYIQTSIIRTRGDWAEWSE